MRRSCAWLRLVTRWLAWSTFTVLASCGGHSSSPTTDPTTPIMDEKSLFLIGALDVNATECVAKPESSAIVLAQGVWDLALTSNYTATLLVGNQLARPGAVNETERISLRSAEITLSTAEAAVLEKYSTVATGFIDAEALPAAYGVMSVNLIPVGLDERVQRAELLIAKIRVTGEALNGTLLTSSELDFPIRVCTGCLVQYPSSAADPTAPSHSTYLCANATEDTVLTTPAPCLPGQDLPFSCALCAESVAMCRDPQLNPSLSK